MMSSSHLTDDDIQAALERGGAALHPDVRAHLNTCDRCRMRARTYDRLFTALSTEPEYRISESVADRIIGRLPDNSGSRRLFPFTEIVLISAGMAAALGVTCIFVDLSPLLEQIRQVQAPKFIFNLDSLKSISPLFKHLNQVIGLLPFAGLVFGLIAFMDRLIRLFKRSHFLII